MITIYDGTCPYPYSFKTLETQAMGGTEATILRLAKKFKEWFGYCEVKQRGRETPLIEEGITFTTLEGPLNPKTKALITLRDAKHCRSNQQLYPEVAHMAYFHDVINQKEYLDNIMVLDWSKQVNLLFVSEWHRSSSIQTLIDHFTQNEKIYPHDRVKSYTVYNPVEVYDIKPTKSYDPTQLVFFSSPHKGLQQVLESFEELQKSSNNRYKLLIANPGYYKLKEADLKSPYIVILGEVCHKKMLEIVANSLCVFYPQDIFPETFGLVLAEANAVGTPVLAYGIGAAPEILSNPAQLIENNKQSIADIIADWSIKGARPVVRKGLLFNNYTFKNQWYTIFRNLKLIP